MAISAVSGTASGLVQPENAVGKKDLKKDDFMKLFITQLQYQDPMKPMDSYQMASQLAEFSNMEATTKMSESMDKLLEYQTSQNNLQLMSLLGNQAQVKGNGIGVVGGAVSPTEFVLEDVPSGTINVTVYDETDRPVWQKDIAANGAGDYAIEWDGKDTLGRAVKDGLYHYQVEAFSPTDEALPVGYMSTGRVTDISYVNGGATLTIDGLIQANAGDVVKVRDAAKLSVESTTSPSSSGQLTPPWQGLVNAASGQ